MLVSDSLALLNLLCAVIVVLMLLKNLSYFANRSFFVMLRGKTIVISAVICFRATESSLEFYGHNQVGDAIVRMVMTLRSYPISLSFSLQ